MLPLELLSLQARQITLYVHELRLQVGEASHLLGSILRTHCHSVDLLAIKLHLGSNFIHLRSLKTSQFILTLV